MTTWKILLLSYFGLLSPILFASPVNSLRINDINTSNVIIEFSPYVSGLDLFNRDRYEIDQLLPLISKVASEFTSMFIELKLAEHTDIGFRTSSQFLSTLAIAKYNCLPKTKQKIKLFLVFRLLGGGSCDCSANPYLVNAAMIFSDEIEQTCNNTIDTIFLRGSQYTFCQNSHCSQLANLSTRYNWGVVMSFTEYCRGIKNIHEFTNTPSRIAIEYEKNILPKNLTTCIPLSQDKLPLSKFLHKISISDTDVDNIINMTRLVETWKVLFEDKDNFYILSQAFDTYTRYRSGEKTMYTNCPEDPDKRFMEHGTTIIEDDCEIILLYEPNGWWYLVNDTGAIKTEDFTFEKRADLANKFDNEEDPRNFEWLRKPGLLNKNWTGIVYSGEVSYEILTKTFCQFFVKENELFRDLIDFLHKANSSESVCESALRVSVIVNERSSEHISQLMAYNNDRICILILVQYHPKYDKLELGPFYEKNDVEISKFNRILENLKNFGISYGYIFDLDSFIFGIEYYLGAITDTSVSRFVFSYEENQVKYGATRMFRFRRLMFTQYGRIILKRQLIFNLSNTHTEVEFALWKYSKLGYFDDSPWAIQNYVKYIYLLNNWAQEQNIVFFVGNDNCDIQGGDTFERKCVDVGWYTQDKQNQKYFTKLDEALKLSMSHYPQKNGTSNRSTISSKEIIFVVGISLTACAVFFLVGIYIMRLYYKKRNLTQDELRNFFDGHVDSETDTIDPQNIPYDRNKYEILKDKFKLQTDETLGSGEFGKVHRGTITIANNDINVAIKTTNPQKLHKTMLTGLLSEIKVLAHLGKHANITQLLGANTENIVDGKVYIFLELCHLGALQKFLMSMHTINNIPAQQQTDENLDIEMRYVNTISNRMNVLDPSLSQDFFRWSIEICNGMAYLAEKHVVHADLATRNVLLNLRREAKICDFGLSRRMYNYTSYVKSQQEPLPWKWMAPEALLHMEFNEKTDVWAYGITLWEIYSLGSTPYAGLSWDVNFVGMLENGLKPSKPDYDEKDMYDIMKNCWKVSPDRRPKFSEILSLLTSGGLEDGDD